MRLKTDIYYIYIDTIRHMLKKQLEALLAIAQARNQELEKLLADAIATIKELELRVHGNYNIANEEPGESEDHILDTMVVGILQIDPATRKRVYALKEPMMCTLVPEPENMCDKNAIQVFADNMCIGYIPKSQNEYLIHRLTSIKTSTVYPCNNKTIKRLRIEFEYNSI